MESKIKNKKNILYKLANIDVGSIPLLLYIVIAIIVYLACIYNKLPIDMIGGFAIIMTMGILLGKIGNKIPIIKSIGGPAILTIFLPSVCVYYNLINHNAINATIQLMKKSNFLYLYISCLIVGSILGMNRKILAKGFIRVFAPIIVGTIVSIGLGLLVGVMFGYSPYKTFFYIITPIISGGIGEGILPLSMGYSDVLKLPQSNFIGQLVPAAMLGNIIAIIFAGILKKLAELKPELTGNGQLIKNIKNDTSNCDNNVSNKKNDDDLKIDFEMLGGGLLVVCTFFILGGLLSKFIGIPGPIIMIFGAAIVKILKLLPTKVEFETYQLYKLITKTLTWPLLVGIGLVYTPWKDLISLISPLYISVCFAVVVGMTLSGYFTGKLLGMYPVESALVTACHSGLGGTGDVAILSSAERLELIPFSQISTRIGGAAMVVIAIMLMKIF